MKLSDSEIHAVIIAAVKAEAWFTHTEVTSDDKLDYEAFQVADELRGALKVVEDKAPGLLKRVCQTCDGSGWWPTVEYGPVCCSECNDDRKKPMPL